METCNAIETLCGVQVGTLGPYLQRLAVVMISGPPVTFTRGKSAVGNRSFADFVFQTLSSIAGNLSLPSFGARTLSNCFLVFYCKIFPHD